MSTPLDLRLDQASFDRWLLGQERKYEWKDGCVVQMTTVTREHASIVSDIVFGLRKRLDNGTRHVASSDFGVEAEDFVRFPDVLVEPKVAGTPRGFRRAHDAIVLFEVLSASSVDADMIEKLEDYTSLPTLGAYVVASQDAAICWLWQRNPETRTFPAKPMRFAGRDQALPLAALGIALPLTELYEDVPTTDD